MADKRREVQHFVVPSHDLRADAVAQALASVAPNRATVVIFPPPGDDYGTFWRREPVKPWEKAESARVLVAWSLPVDPHVRLEWRDLLVQEANVAEYRFALLPSDASTDWTEWLRLALGDWVAPRPAPEDVAVRRGTRVAGTTRATSGFEAGFATVPPFGPMNDLMRELDECRRTYRRVIGTDIDARRERVLTHVDTVLARKPEDAFSPTTTTTASKRPRSTVPATANVDAEVERVNTALARIAKESKVNEFILDRRTLPRVLLLGDSGVGKTLVAHYLSRRAPTSAGDKNHERFKRIPIPNYLQREDAFEHEVFGYCGGAYTSARPRGSRGFLLERMGGVVFFDEIGDANPALQAKLLAYLDDYLVSPVGWDWEPIACPTLVVAATNRPLSAWVAEDSDSTDARFRNDLFQRFNVVLEVPSLRQRIDELDYLLEVLLADPALNPGLVVTVIGEKALDVVRDAVATGLFDNGNFRLLESAFKRACLAAAADGRDYLVEADVRNALGSRATRSSETAA